MQDFHSGSPTHLATDAVCLVLMAAAVLVGRSLSEERERLLRRSWVVGIVVVQVVQLVLIVRDYDPQHSLPLHLCDVAVVAAALAMWTRARVWRTPSSLRSSGGAGDHAPAAASVSEGVPTRLSSRLNATTKTATLPSSSQRMRAAGDFSFPELIVNSLCTTKRCYRRTLRRRSALPMTDTDERLMAAAAIIGESRMPRNG